MEMRWREEEKRRLRLRELIRSKPKKKKPAPRVDIVTLLFGSLFGGEPKKPVATSSSSRSNSSSTVSSSSVEGAAGKARVGGKGTRKKQQKGFFARFVNVVDDKGGKIK